MPTTLTTQASREQSLQEELLEEMFDEAAEIEADADADDEPTQVEDSPADDAPAEVPVEEPAPPADRFAPQRAELQRRIASSTRLPPAVRNLLGEAVTAAAWNEAGQEQAALSISQTINWLESALPRQFTLDANRVEESEHRYGDAFFSGRTDQLNDEQAAQLAAEQLAATGFGPAS